MGIQDINAPNLKFATGPSKRFINYFLNEEERKNPNIGHVSLSTSNGFMKYTDTIMGSNGASTDVEEKHYYPIAYRVQQEIYKQKGKQCEEIINVYVQ